ncbi:hypothetical protein, partial [Bacillus subtilis]|uniref:hypothetical protein n=1 Tax=Bacillus subtilis TaxID=1423 RepID=UPI0016435227
KKGFCEKGNVIVRNERLFQGWEMRLVIKGENLLGVGIDLVKEEVEKLGMVLGIEGEGVRRVVSEGSWLKREVDMGCLFI